MGRGGVEVVNLVEDAAEEARRALPIMPVKVLLAEGDDSTRHVISALLRKCGYHVSAASDGVKAWEILKEKSFKIDLVLTEVELPSMSGFLLLSTIMEHDACKNIPVISMCSNYVPWRPPWLRQHRVWATQSSPQTPLSTTNSLQA